MKTINGAKVRIPQALAVGVCQSGQLYGTSFDPEKCSFARTTDAMEFK